MKNILAFLAFSIMSTTVFADQCAYVSLSEARKAMQVLTEAKSVKSLCELCGEKKAQSVVIESLTMKKTGLDRFWEIRINNTGIDLAYTYVDGKNLAQMAGCQTEGVRDQL